MIVVTRYNEAYAPYKPFWEFCINKAYPEYSYHACESKHPAIDRLLINPYPSHYDDQARTVYHDYHYITDIDMMILPESVSIKDFHVKEMREENLCYSNSPRNNKEERAHDRVTGLHFVGHEWFEKTADLRKKYQDAADRGVFTERIDDELLLKTLIVESGLALPKKKSLIARHHGIHFGTLRAYKHHDWARRKENLRLRITPEIARKYQEVASCDEWKDMVKNAPKWLQEEMSEMDRFTKTRQKQ